MAFQVSSRIDSRTILDQQGAEELLGHGDMLLLPPGTGLPERIHGAFVDDHEVHAVVNSLKQQGDPNYLEEVLHDTQTTADGQRIGATGLPESGSGTRMTSGMTRPWPGCWKAAGRQCPAFSGSSGSA